MEALGLIETKGLVGSIEAADAAVKAAAAAGVWYTLYRTESDVAAGQRVKLTIPPGTSSSEVGRMLADKGVVANATMFDLQARMEGISSRLKAGPYTLTTGSDYAQVFKVLTMGPPPVKYTKLTIPEGWTIGQVAARVEKATGIKAFAGYRRAQERSVGR